MTAVRFELTRKRMKSIRLRVVPPHGVVKVSAPHGVPLHFIEAFVADKADWVCQQQARIEQLPPPLEIDEAACRAILTTRVPALIAYWQTQLGVVCTGWRVRKMKTRWGSCNIKTGRINLNLVLGALDDALLEYVVVHELVHLHERYHNKRFYTWVEKMLPDWREREAKLESITL
ncbi:M48 family peptidase [Aliidiomarina taiwanensis]|uniref:M48 family peptidase n=1 Tax=Aliidiomarina taiwanensis TaxID=946228 RepID=A0A432X9K0_9GAMM|nr:SprT family zinc-dependent metalloprotease [Aliidiomarina taiwanensis]RUO43990.1 M48 family peptidase [Aliidiomarina taiwanensis]